MSYFRHLPVLLICLLAFQSPEQACAQPYGNEWIQYQQQYFRFRIAEDGMYRIPYQTLANALMPFGVQPENIPPQNMQIWGQGQQQAIWIETGSDGVFNAGDYLEFFARKNDGWFDHSLYQDTFGQVNKKYSLFTDTATYYFSWNATANNARLIRETNTAYQLYTAIPWLWCETNAIYSETYLEGERFNTSSPSITIGDAAYTSGEGFAGNKIWVNQTQVRTVSLPELYAQGPQAQAEFTIVAGSNRQLTAQQHYFKAQCGSQVLVDTSWRYYHPVTFSKALQMNTISSGSASFAFSNPNYPGQILQEWTSVSDISVRYPRYPAFPQSVKSLFKIPAQYGTDFAHIRLTGIQVPANDSVRMLDLTNGRLYSTAQEGQYLHALIRNFPGEEAIFFSLCSNITQIEKLTAVSDADARFIRYEPAVFPEIDYLIITDNDLLDAAAQYATYRKTEGYPQLFSPVVVDIEQLYDQFAFGICKTPLSIRNFLRHVSHQYTKLPSHLFLIGKAIQSKDIRKDHAKWKMTRVPSYGHPPSDWMYTLGLRNQDKADIPTGRLSAYSPGDVFNYLEKMTAHELSLKNVRQSGKNILQFGGGSNFLEQSIFRSYLSFYDSLLSSPFTGYFSHRFFKTSLDPVVIAQSSQLNDLIVEQGVGLIQYFGHASGINFDISIGDPAGFNNKDKYYFVIANSCWAGDIFDYHGGISSEHYVLLPLKGAIGYLASVTEGEAPYLHTFSSAFLKAFATTHYGLPIGTIAAGNIGSILGNPSYTAFSFREVCLEMALHADPAMVLYAPPQPDYHLNPGPDCPQTLSTIPEEINTASSRFTLRIIPANAGKALDTMLFVRIERWIGETPAGDTLLRVCAPLFRDTILVDMETGGESAGGLNRFRVNLDALNEIDEGTMETNNTAELTVNIRSTGLIPVLPDDNAIVPSPSVSLTTSTVYPFLSQSSFAFQLDTSYRFDSPIRKDTVITAGGGVISWHLDLPVQTDSTVYYWRTGPDQTPADSIRWQQRSFQYIPGITGWSQARTPQMERNQYLYIRYLPESDSFCFVEEMNELHAQTYIINHPWQEEYFRVGFDIKDVWSCAQNRCPGSSGIKFAVFNPVSFEPWISYNNGNGIGQYGNKHCRDYPVAAFDFCNYDSADRQIITKFIDTIPEGYYVLAFSHKNHKAQESETSLYQAFESLGAQHFRFMQDTSPYMIFGIKGSLPGTAIETGPGCARDSLANITTTVVTNWKQGSITTPPIGPSSAWHSLHWRAETDDNDSIRLVLIGIKENSASDTLIGVISRDSSDIYHLDSSFAAADYPYMQMILVMEDNSATQPSPRDPARLKRWQIIFETLPETAIDPSSGFSFYNDSLVEGDSARLKIAYRNIGGIDMDSLLVTYWLNNGSKKDTLDIRRLRPHPAGDILLDSLIIPTLGRSGRNQLWIEINPQHDQPELTHVNNLAGLSFFVLTDRENPILDVTFDGKHIRDLDYVSPSPEIIMRLTDDKYALRLADTSLITAWLAKPGQDSARLTYSGAEETALQFFPAESASNYCITRFCPHLPEGIYTLTVSAADASGNPSGTGDYRIRFRIVTGSTRSELFAWPNPFSDFTRFTFILTGDALPVSFGIHLYDLTGRHLRTISADEFGPVHTGTNVSRTVWDGRDRNGNLLPNGMYLYRLDMDMQGEQAAVRNDLDSKYGNYQARVNGKIIIMR
ncbi:MAG TPA: C25 family cysteine peptidase [Bacteroidales bacterium]|nr:C25 family cysteine peptidase [Bacteroidales bacterium]HSA42824.1 C25 family cysteine peptidase [Bacteroidales bacterium]